MYYFYISSFYASVLCLLPCSFLCFWCSSLSLFFPLLYLGSDWWNRRWKCNLIAIRLWGCKVAVAAWLVARKTLLIAGSCTGEGIGNHRDKLRASLLFSGSTICPMYFPLLAMMGC